MPVIGTHANTVEHRHEKENTRISTAMGAAFSVVIFYYYAMHGCMPGLEAEPRAMPHTERYAVSPRRALRAAMPAMALTTPNDPGDVVTKHASGHASPLA